MNNRASEQMQKLLAFLHRSGIGGSEITSFVIEECIKISESELGFFGFIDKNKTKMTAHLWSEQAMKTCAIDNKPVKFPVKTAGIWAESIRTHRSFVDNNFEEIDSRKKGYPFGHVKIKRFLSIPVIRKNRVVAILALANKKQDYTYTDILHLSLFIENIWLLFEKKEAELAIIKNEAYYRALIENSSDIITIINAEGVIKYNSPAIEKVLGYEKSELISHDVWDYIHPDDLPLVIDTFTTLKQKPGLTLSIEFRLLDKSGSWRCFEVTGSNLIKNNIVKGIVLNSHDISERKNAEIFKKENNRKNEFISILSHELRNPLTSIMMGISLMECIPPDGEQVLQVRDIIKRQTTQLSRLVDDLLDITRITQNKIILKKERIELNRLIYQAVEDNQIQFSKKNVELAVELSTEPLYFEADPARLTQVIGNLLNNAAKFTSKGDKTTVIVKRDVHTWEAVITVLDTGLGIQPDLLPNLFEPFMQAERFLDRSRGGLGLGLSIVKGMVELHGGKVTVHSEGLGCGAKFIIRLPVELSEKQEQEYITTKVPTRSMRILIIDDIADISEIFCTLLRNLGHEVIIASNGAEGIFKAKEFQPEVIFCDIGLPDMNGYDVAKRIRSDTELKDVFLTALSGYAQPEDLECSKLAGFNQHLAKPVNMDTLEKILAEIP